MAGGALDLQLEIVRGSAVFLLPREFSSLVLSARGEVIAAFKIGDIVARGAHVWRDDGGVGGVCPIVDGCIPSVWNQLARRQVFRQLVVLVIKTKLLRRRV